LPGKPVLIACQHTFSVPVRIKKETIDTKPGIAGLFLLISLAGTPA
jgi:hypothetical protein